MDDKSAKPGNHCAAIASLVHNVDTVTRQRRNTQRAASGISIGTAPSPELAATAVRNAMARQGPSRIGSVLLFLTPDFAFDLKTTLAAVAREANCTQVVGCTGPGILTEEAHVSEGSAAAALLLDSTLSLWPSNRSQPDQLKLTFATPDAVSTEWLDAPTLRFGAIAADMFGHGPFCVWRGGRPDDDGLVEVSLGTTHGVAAASQGVRALTAPVSVGKVSGYDVLQIGQYPALNVLLQSLPQSTDPDASALNNLMCGVTFGDPQTAIRDGRYRLNHIVSADKNNQSITLSDSLNPGEHLFWAVRDRLASERAMTQTVSDLAENLGDEPDYALLFPCLTRGATFYGNGRDRDIELIKQRFDGLPIIGFYGNGQIAPLGLGAHLYQFSAAVGLFSAARPIH